MPYRLLAPLVLVRVPRQGNGDRIDYHYLALNPYIPWLNDQQREQFLKEGLVEEIPDAGHAAAGVDAGFDLRPPTVADRSPAAECIAALDLLGISPSCGAPTAREALRAHGRRFGNDVIAAAVKARKSGRALSGTISAVE